MDTLIPKVLQAVAGENFTVYLYFNDGSVRLYDAKLCWSWVVYLNPYGTRTSLNPV